METFIILSLIVIAFVCLIISMKDEIIVYHAILSLTLFFIFAGILLFLTLVAAGGPICPQNITTHIPKENYEIVKLPDKLLFIDKTSGKTDYATEKKIDFDKIDKFDGFDVIETKGFGPDTTKKTIKFNE